MKLYEYQAKEIFSKYDIPVPREVLACSSEDAVKSAEEIGLPVVLKAQVLTGGRGKAGGVKVVKDREEVSRKANDILGMEIKGFKVKKLLVAEMVDIASEAYVGVIVDRRSRRPVFMASPAGGVDIEEVARTTPEKIFKVKVDPYLGLLPHSARWLAFKLYFDPTIALRAASIMQKLYRVFVDNDASLVEINPLVVTRSGDVYALDAKLVIDDNALYRHPDLEEMREILPEEEKEIRAKEKGLSYIKLDGDIGCVVNGAGLAMATMDIIKRYGGEPANFLDIGGSSSPRKVENAMELLLSDRNVKAIWFNIFGGITRCDDVARGMVEALRQMDVKLPVVVRLTGTNEEEGKRILATSGLPLAPVSSMAEGAKKVIELARG